MWCLSLSGAIKISDNINLNKCTKPKAKQIKIESNIIKAHSNDKNIKRGKRHKRQPGNSHIYIHTLKII